MDPKEKVAVAEGGEVGDKPHGTIHLSCVRRAVCLASHHNSTMHAGMIVGIRLAMFEKRRCMCPLWQGTCGPT